MCYPATGSRSATRRGRSHPGSSGRAGRPRLEAALAPAHGGPLRSRAEPWPPMSRSAAVEPSKVPPTCRPPPPFSLQATPSAADAYRRTKHFPARYDRRASAARTSARRCALLRRQAARRPRASPAMLTYSSSCFYFSKSLLGIYRTFLNSSLSSLLLFVGVAVRVGVEIEAPTILHKTITITFF